MKRSTFLLINIIWLLVLSCQLSQKKISPNEAKQIAKSAYIFGFPLVMNYKTLYANTIDKNSGDYKGDFNQKSCEARVFTPEDKAIVTPNSDTPYCMFWSDLRNGPVVFSVPDIDPSRYYSFQLIDLYTHNFSYIGSLTTGSNAGNYLITLDSWKGEIPEGITKVIHCETDFFFTIIRTQMFSTSDLENVKNLQDQYQIQTLDEYLGKPSVKVAHHDVFPTWVEGDQFTTASFKYLDTMLKFINPTEKEDSLINTFSKIGLGNTMEFDINNFEPDIRAAIEEGVKEGFAEMETFIKSQSSDPLGSTKIFGTREFLEKSAMENYGFDNFYLLRAVGAYLGIYGNSASEASYPMYLTDSDGQLLDASKNDYTLTFAPGQEPPVSSFWSLTLYDGKTQLLVDNSLNKYLISSTAADKFVRNDDGSITLYIQKESPGESRESNWLPAPNGTFYCVLRLYGPNKEVLLGQWLSPKMIKQDS